MNKEEIILDKYLSSLIGFTFKDYDAKYIRDSIKEIKDNYKQALLDIKEYIKTRAGTEIRDMMYIMETDEILDIVNKALGDKENESN